MTKRPCSPMPRSGRTWLQRAALVGLTASTLVACGHDYLSSGRQFMEKGDIAAAIIEFKNAVQDKPGALAPRLALADALEKTYDLAGAEQHLEKAIGLGGDANALAPRIALLLLELGQPDQIITEFKERTLTDPAANSDLHAAVAMAYIARHRLPPADEQLQKLNPATPAVHLAKSQRYLLDGDVDRAAAELNQGIAQAKSGEAIAWWLQRALARTHEAAGKPDQALSAIRAASEAAPWHLGLLGEYGDALITAGKFDEAAEIKNRLQAKAPNYYWTQFLNAVLLAKDGQIEASQAAAQKVLAVAPEHLRANLLLASSELQSNKAILAEDRLRKLTKTHPASLPLLQALSIAQLRLGKTDEANANIRKGLTLAPNDGRLLSLKADVEILRGETKEAATTLEQLIARQPKDVDSYLRLSQIKANSGNGEAAAKLLDQAAELGKDTPQARDRIIAIALRGGNKNLAGQLADYATATYPKDPRSHLALTATRAAQGDRDGAWRSTIAALDLDPSYQPALNALTGLTKTTEQRTELLARYEKALAGKPQSPETFNEYLRLMREGNKTAAEIVALLGRGVAAFPTATDLRAALIAEHLAAGNKEAAVTAAQNGAAGGEAPPAAMALLADTYERTGNTVLAGETYRKLTTAYPQTAEWRLRLAEMELRTGRKQEAIKQLQSLIADFPAESAAYVRLALLQVKDAPEEALAIARQLGKQATGKTTALLLEGDLLASAGKIDEALKAYGDAGKLGATPPALLSSIRLLDRAKRGRAADQELMAALHKYPDHPAVLSFAGRRALAQGNTGDAIRFFQQAVAKNSTDPVALNDLAWAQTEAGKPEALVNAQRAAALAPGHPGILDTLAMAQAAAGKHREALSNLRAATNLSPADPTLKLHLAKELLATGNKTEAAAILDKIEPGPLSAQDHALLKKLKNSD